MFHFTVYKYNGTVDTFIRESFSFNYKDFFEDHPEVRDFMVQWKDVDQQYREDFFYR